MRAMRCLPVFGLLSFLTVGCVVEHETIPASTDSSGSGGQGGSPGAGGAGGEGGAGGQGGTTIVIDDSGSETCPGNAFELTVGDEYVFEGTTKDTVDDYSAFCGDTTADKDTPEVVYQFTLPEDGTLFLEVEGDGDFNPALVVRSVCTTEDDTSRCYDFSPNSKETLLDHFVAGTYYVMVEGSGKSSGDFRLTARLSKPTCGDGVLNSAEEQCDPTPISDNDGCTDPGFETGGCKFEAPEESKDLCPGESHELTTEGLALLSSEGNTTLNYEDDYSGSCSKATGGHDRVFRITPTESGTMTVTIGLAEDGETNACLDTTQASCWDNVLYVRSTCDSTETEIACSDGEDGTQPETVSIPVTAGTPYYVFVDGYDGEYYSRGTFNLFATLTAQ